MQLRYETDRLVLQILNESYTFQVLTFLSQNCDLFERYEGEKSENFYSMSYIHDMLQAEYNQIIKWKSLRFYVFEKQNPNRIIGTISLSSFRHTPYFSCHIGYKFASSHHGKGYAYEALSFMLKHIVPEYRIHRITAYIANGNEPSKRLIEKLGFVYEGTARDYAKIHGIWTDHMQYSLLCDETQ